LAEEPAFSRSDMSDQERTPFFGFLQTERLDLSRGLTRAIERAKNNRKVEFD
jgi:hypothetical protein